MSDHGLRRVGYPRVRGASRLAQNSHIRRCEVESVICVSDRPKSGSVGRVGPESILSRFWVGRSENIRLGTRDNITTRGCFCSINQLYRPCGHPPAFPQHAHHDWWTNCTTNRGLTCKNTCTRSKTGPSTHARQRSRAAHNRKSGRERRTRTTKTRQKSLPGPMWMILHRWV